LSLDSNIEIINIHGEGFRLLVKWFKDFLDGIFSLFFLNV
jgi:hypothetical protein